MKEKWMIVENFEDYAVSSMGNVKNIKNGKILKQNINGDYNYVQLKKRNFRVHRLVALMFIPNNYNKPYVNHLDGNKSNNIVENLEWCTAQENNLHARKTGLIKQNKPVIITDINTNETITFESTNECARFLNSNNGSINRVLKGKRNKHKNFFIKYL
ncbi:MAG: HNH endonuclease [Methanogenium sp.]|jgi:hypothetical protein